MVASKKQMNTRLPDITNRQIDEIAIQYGMTKTQVLMLAVDRLSRDLRPDVDYETSLYAKAEAVEIAENGGNGVKQFG